MKHSQIMEAFGFAGLVVMLILAIVMAAQAADDPLPSWNEGTAKTNIIAFVEKVTKEGGVEFFPPAERIAVFGNDGTLWAEQAHARAACVSTSLSASRNSSGVSRYRELVQQNVVAADPV